MVPFPAIDMCRPSPPPTVAEDIVNGAATAGTKRGCSPTRRRCCRRSFGLRADGEHRPPDIACSFRRSEKVARRFCFRPSHRWGQEGFSKSSSSRANCIIAADCSRSVTATSCCAAPAKAPPRTIVNARVASFLSVRSVVFSFLLSYIQIKCNIIIVSQTFSKRLLFFSSILLY